MFKGTDEPGVRRVLAHRRAQRRQRERLHRPRLHRLFPDHRQGSPGDGHADGGRSHDQPASSTPEEVLTERDVVLEERSQRVDNDPGARLGEQVNATQYLQPSLPPAGDRLAARDGELHARGRARLLPHLVRAQQRGADRRRRHRRRRAAAARREVLRRDPGAAGARAPRLGQEPPQDAPREVELERPARAAAVAGSAPTWRRASPPARREHAYPLEVLAEIFGGTSTSRLYRSLVIDQKLATSAGAYYRGSVARPDHVPGLRQPAPGRHASTSWRRRSTPSSRG